MHIEEMSINFGFGFLVSYVTQTFAFLLLSDIPYLYNIINLSTIIGLISVFALNTDKMDNETDADKMYKDMQQYESDNESDDESDDEIYKDMPPLVHLDCMSCDITKMNEYLNNAVKYNMARNEETATVDEAAAVKETATVEEAAAVKETVTVEEAAAVKEAATVEEAAAVKEAATALRARYCPHHPHLYLPIKI